LPGGYAALVEWLGKELRQAGVAILTGHGVHRLQWRRGHVTALLTKGDPAEAERVLVTLPLGVLQSKDSESLFAPDLPGKRAAAKALVFGHVSKTVFQFHQAFWPVPRFGFAHDSKSECPTCWSGEAGDMIVAWAGGPKGESLLRRGPDQAVAKALQAVSRMFNTPKDEVERLLESCVSHDWLRDPCSRGSYSYVAVNGLGAPAALAEPVENTLFFAGEATVADGRNGTVHGAIQSGWRAASEILARS